LGGKIRRKNSNGESRKGVMPGGKASKKGGCKVRGDGKFKPTIGIQPSLKEEDLLGKNGAGRVQGGGEKKTGKGKTLQPGKRERSRRLEKCTEKEREPGPGRREGFEYRNARPLSASKRTEKRAVISEKRGAGARGGGGSEKSRGRAGN